MEKQLIEVCGHRLRFYEGESLIFESYCGFGRGGFTSDKCEGDGCTPVGTFSIESAFGFEEDPKCHLPYRRITPNSYWSGEREDYNSRVEVEPGKRDMKRSERLADYPVEYKLSLVISYNTSTPEWGRGSAIFLHCRNTPKWQTSGCISLPESKIRLLLERLKPGAIIKIRSASK